MTGRKTPLLLLTMMLVFARGWSDQSAGGDRPESRFREESRPVQEKGRISSAINSSDRVIIHRLTGPVTLDGRVEEEAWNGAASLSLVMQTPEFGGPPSEQTDVLFGFDDDYLYIGARLFDSEPDKIQAPSKKRDYMQGDTEWFGIVLDTFNDKENGLAFYTTPTGLRFDGAIFNDGVPAGPDSMPINLSWNTFWDVETLVDDRGWFVEMRIPFSSLRFQDSGGQVVMGLIATRYIPRKNESDIFPAIPPNWGMFSQWKCSRACEVELEGVRSRNPLYITPYALAGYGQSYDLNEAETAYIRDNQPTLEAGLDIKYGLTSNLTLDLTVNTDFAQVEADDVQVNLTRYSLFFPEKRLFFQERSSIFDFTFGGPTQLFYSRTIGLHDDKMVRIYGGARLVGRMGGWDIGFLDMQTAPMDDLSSENFGVLRIRRRVFNPYSYVGGLLTSRIGTDGSYNVVYGLDSQTRISENDYILLAWAQSFDRNRPVSSRFLDIARFRLGWERRTNKGLGGMFTIGRRGPDYDPGMGFEMLEDYWVIGNSILYGWLPGAASPLQSHNVSNMTRVIFRNEDGGLRTLLLQPGWAFSAKSGWFGHFSLMLQRESLTELFELSDDVSVPVGDYTFFGFQGIVMTPMNRMINAMVSAEAGEFYDGSRLSLGITPNWTVADDISLSGFYQYNRVVFPDRSLAFTAHIARIKLEATLSTAFTASAFLQYNSAVSAVIANIRLRFNPREGTDLYLVINESFYTDRNREVPPLPPYGSRAVMIKYSTTFNF
ncbi:MAG: carbohydrate binding family 9 domain-containing protein [Acidobacteria bacterium]|nr:carbohydrate binding family 9 domain-containing protein [Acidobacteriota bacterium]